MCSVAPLAASIVALQQAMRLSQCSRSFGCCTASVPDQAPGAQLCHAASRQGAVVRIVAWPYDCRRYACCEQLSLAWDLSCLAIPSASTALLTVAATLLAIAALQASRCSVCMQEECTLS